MSGTHDADWNDEMYLAHPTPYAKGLAAWASKSRVRIVRSLADIGPEDRVLEIGCEAGHLITRLPHCDLRVGGDISMAALRDACSRAGRTDGEVRFLQLDAQSPLPFRKGEFSVVISSEMIEHVDDPRKVIECVHQICDPSTRVVLTVPIEAPKLLLKKVLRATGVFRLLFPGVEAGMSEWHLHEFDRAMLRECIRGLFEIEKQRIVWGMHYCARLRPIL